eukprot:scaffold910_cov396-Prasinococcus_capsulatus_cf.AAC.5
MHHNAKGGASALGQMNKHKPVARVIEAFAVAPNQAISCCCHAPPGVLAVLSSSRVVVPSADKHRLDPFRHTG